MLVSAFLVVPTLNTARTKIDLIKSYFSLLPGTKTRSGEMWRKGKMKKEEVGCFRSWPASFFLPLSGEELQTVRESHAAVYLHFSISSHSSLYILKEPGNQYWHQGGRAASLHACKPPPGRFFFFNYTNLSALLWEQIVNVLVGYYSYTTQCAKSALINLRQKEAKIRLNAVLCVSA